MKSTLLLLRQQFLTNFSLGVAIIFELVILRPRALAELLGGLWLDLALDSLRLDLVLDGWRLDASTGVDLLLWPTS